MTQLRDGRLIPIETQRDDTDGPTEVYLMDSGTAGVYVLGVGAKASEATAFLSDVGSDTFAFDTTDEDRTLLRYSSDTVIL